MMVKKLKRNRDTASLESIKDDARATAKKAAEEIYHIRKLHYRYNRRYYRHELTQRLDDRSYNNSNDGNHLSSSDSHQVAIERGSSRACNEEGDDTFDNPLLIQEQTNPSEKVIFNNYDKNSQNKGQIQNQSKYKWRRKKKYKSHDDHSSLYSSDLSSVVVTSEKSMKGFSMCRCCGAIFEKEFYAWKHELKCIERGVNEYKLSKCTGDTISTISTTTKALMPMEGQVTISNGLKKRSAIFDDDLIKVVLASKKLLVSKEKLDAQRELALMAKNRSFYDMRAIRSVEITVVKKKKKKHVGTNILRKLQDKLADAYVIIKEGDDDHQLVDKYTTRRRPDSELKHDDDTIYINVIVKHSATLLHNELERLAQQRWTNKNNDKGNYKNNFETIRYFSQVQALRFAKFSLSSDVKPEKIAVQLSNDLSRNISQQLNKQFGVVIETNIEYRYEEYFILSANVLTIDWIMMMKYFYEEGRKRKKDWSHHKTDIVNNNEVDTSSLKFAFNYLCRMTRLEKAEQLLAALHYINWIVSVPLCIFLYKFFLKAEMERLVVTTVTDQFFKYVEHKGLEMDLQVKRASQQAAFMFDVLNQMRKNKDELNKKKTEIAEGETSEATRGPLLGPLFPGDDMEAGIIPEELRPPANLEFEVFESDLPVGYRRLRKALLYNSTFTEQAVFRDTLMYTDISLTAWDKHDGKIGEIETSNDVEDSDFIGAKRDAQYLMPASVFVKANMAYESTEIISYNDYFFSLKKRTRNPDVPYGKTFYAWTQMTVYNAGRNKCRIVCSAEAEFPEGPPIVARSIRSAMRQGVTEMFLKFGETICKYS